MENRSVVVLGRGVQRRAGGGDIKEPQETLEGAMVWLCPPHEVW
jgi:hypothetical protein